METKRPSNKSEKGQSLVELGVGILILLLLLAGIIDLGRLLFFSISLRDAAQEANVFGQINPRSCAQINQRITDYLKSELQNPPEITIDGLSCLTAASLDTRSCSGKEIKIKLKAPFRFSMPFISGQTLMIATEITGTILRPACGS